MSDEAISAPKSSRFKALKIALLLAAGLMIIILLTAGILYFTNTKAKTAIDAFSSRLGIPISGKPKEENADKRVSELAVYFTSMDIERATDKLYAIKQEDKKLYQNMISEMAATDSAFTEKLTENIRIKEEKPDALMREYESMSEENNKKISEMSAHYTSLGTKGAIDAIEQQLTLTMDFSKMADIIETMQPSQAAKILYYMTPAYSGELLYSVNPEYRAAVEKEIEKHAENVRAMTSSAGIYEKMDPQKAAADLENSTTFDTDDTAIMFSKIDYFNAARILNNYSSPEAAIEILSKLNEYEALETEFDGSLSKAISDSMKILTQYENDKAALVKTYSNMPAPELADIIDNLTDSETSFKQYQIDDLRQFRILERDMAVEVLKQSKPRTVSALLAQLKNTGRLDKATMLSRELGIPNP